MDDCPFKPGTKRYNLWYNDKAWRSGYDLAKKIHLNGKTTVDTKNGKCDHLGDQIGERDCKSCGDRTVKLKVYACSHPEHAETTIPECNKCQHASRSD